MTTAGTAAAAQVIDINLAACCNGLICGLTIFNNVNRAAVGECNNTVLTNDYRRAVNNLNDYIVLGNCCIIHNCAVAVFIRFNGFALRCGNSDTINIHNRSRGTTVSSVHLTALRSFNLNTVLTIGNCSRTVNRQIYITVFINCAAFFANHNCGCIFSVFLNFRTLRYSQTAMAVAINCTALRQFNRGIRLAVLALNRQ